MLSKVFYCGFKGEVEYRETLQPQESVTSLQLTIKNDRKATYLMNSVDK